MVYVYRGVGGGGGGGEGGFGEGGLVGRSWSLL